MTTNRKKPESIAGVYNLGPELPLFDLPKGKSDHERAIRSFLTNADDKKRFGRYFVQDNELYYAYFVDGTNLVRDSIARRIVQDNRMLFIGNSSTLEGFNRAFGRSRSWGRRQGAVQELLSRLIPMIPFNALEQAGLDLTQYRLIEQGPEETVKEKIVNYDKNDRRKEKLVDRHFIGAQLFSIGADHYLFDYDRRELKNGILNAFMAKLPNASESIAAAYESLKPVAVVEAEKQGLKVRRQGEWFFIPVKTAPTKGQRIFDSKNKTRWGGSESLELRAGNNRPNNASKGFVHDKTNVTYVTGRISHRGREHADLMLKGWHIAVPNTATESFTITGDVD